MTPVNSVSNSANISPLSIKTGIGGLVSGMNIDDLVESLTSQSRSKLAKQQQLMQNLLWQQNSYRSVTTELNDFQNKFFDVLSKTNFKSASFFNLTSSFASSDAISVSSTIAASAGSFTINSIDKLATNQTVESAMQVSKSLKSSKTITEIVSGLSAGDFISINLNGKSKVVTFNSDFISAIQTDESILPDRLQSLVDEAFGFTNEYDRAIKITANTENFLVLDASGSTLSINTVGQNMDASEAFGFIGGQSNRINLNSSLSLQTIAIPLINDEQSFTINGESFNFNSSDSLRTIIETINSSKAGVTISYSSISDKFSIVAKESGAGENIRIAQINGNLMEALGLTGENSKATAGENATLMVNGQKIIRSTNNIDIDGVKVTLNELSNQRITVTVKSDALSLLDPIKGFVEKYNSLMDLMNGFVKEKVNRDYPPLTDKQKSDMTESQIKDWEEKAKSGILRSDPILRKILSNMNSAVTGLSVNGFSLYSMGISTSGYGGGGKLQIDENKLKEVLENNSNKVRELFIADNGLSMELERIILGATKTIGAKGSRGTLVDTAGIENTRSDTENIIFDKMQKAKNSIDLLMNKLKREETQYWKRFTYMETVLNNLNSQSMLLYSFSDQ